MKCSQKGITLLTFFLGSFLFLLPIAKTFSLNSTLLDLGIFESLLYRIGNNHDWQAAFFGHAHWFAFPFGWLYGLLPLPLAPYALVGLQAIILLLPAFWFYKRFGSFAAFAYISYYPLWANAHFDFHFDHLAVPLLLGFYWALLDRRIGWAVLCATLVMFVKEPFALQTAGCGVLLILGLFKGKCIWTTSETPPSNRCLAIGGIWLIFAGLSYFYFVTNYVASYFDFDDAGLKLGNGPFGWLGNTPNEIIQTIITSPHLILGDIISTPGKLTYLNVVFNLLASISLLRPVFLIPALPLLTISMLSHLPNFYSISNHYTAGLIIPVTIAFVYGLPRAEKIIEWIFVKVCISWAAINDKYTKIYPGVLSNLKGPSYSLPSLIESRPGLLRKVGITFKTIEGRNRIFYVLLFSWILAGHIWYSPSPISRLFWSDQAWAYNWNSYLPTKRDEMMKEAMKKYVPLDYHVSVTTQNTVNTGHLAHRKIYLPFPLNIAEPHPMMDWSSRTWEGFWEFVRTGYKSPDIRLNQFADYVVLDLKRPFFLIDQGCQWIDGECRNNKSMEKKFLEWVVKTENFYNKIFENDGFIIFHRKNDAKS